MKTKIVRPVLVESKEINKIGDICLFPYGLNIAGKEDIGYSKQELILISLEDEKIEVGDRVYEKNLNTETSVYEVYKRNDKLGFFRFRNVFIPFDKQNSAKKVIALQSQLSPEYIQQFIEEHNKGDVKDLRIEMEKWFDQDAEIGCDWGHKSIKVRPKLTNGYVIIVNKEVPTYTEKEAKIHITKH